MWQGDLPTTLYITKAQSSSVVKKKEGRRQHYEREYYIWNALSQSLSTFLAKQAYSNRFGTKRVKTLYSSAGVHKKMRGSNVWEFPFPVFPSRYTIYVYNAIYDIHNPLARKIQYMFIQYIMSHIQYVLRGSIFVQMWDLQTPNFDLWLYSIDRWSWLCVIQYFVWWLIIRYCYTYDIYKNIPSRNHITFITLCRFRICQFSRYFGNFVSSRHASTWVICISA